MGLEFFKKGSALVWNFACEIPNGSTQNKVRDPPTYIYLGFSTA